jgi:hypothetical protein
MSRAIVSRAETGISKFLAIGTTLEAMQENLEEPPMDADERRQDRDQIPHASFVESAYYMDGREG